MRWTNFLVAAGLTSMGEALLLPPNVGMTDSFKTIALEHAVPTSHVGFALPCQFCPSRKQCEADPRRILQLNFDIPNARVQDPHQVLTMNNKIIYPVEQLPSLNSMIGIESSNDRESALHSSVDYTLFFDVDPTFQSDDGSKLIKIRVHILSIDMITVAGLQDVMVSLILMPDGQLRIAFVETTGAPNNVPVRLDCPTRQIFPSRPPAKKNGSGIRAVLHFFRNAFFYFLLPISAGIVGGLILRLLAAFITRSATFLWLKHRRGRQDLNYVNFITHRQPIRLADNEEERGELLSTDPESDYQDEERIEEGEPSTSVQKEGKGKSFFG